MSRAAELATWRAGYEAGLAAGNRQRDERNSVQHDLAITEFHERRKADQQAKVDALVLDAVHLLAGAMLGAKVVDEAEVVDCGAPGPSCAPQSHHTGEAA